MHILLQQTFIKSDKFILNYTQNVFPNYVFPKERKQLFYIFQSCNLL